MASSSPSLPGAHHRVLAGSMIKGLRVHNFAGEDLGKVDELACDLDTGRIAYVVVSLGGFLGIGDKLFAVPWELFTVRAGEPVLFVDIDKAMLTDAPGFDRSKWPDMADPAWAGAIHSHYAQKPYWNRDITDAGDYIGDDRLDKPDRDRL